MSFIDEVRRNYRPKENKTHVVSDDDIEQSAKTFVETVKRILLEYAKNGQTQTRKKGLFREGQTVEYSTVFFKNKYIQLPVLGDYEGEPNYSYWSVPENPKIMEKWNRMVYKYLAENGIEHTFSDSNKYRKASNIYYIWL